MVSEQEIVFSWVVDDLSEANNYLNWSNILHRVKQEINSKKKEFETWKSSSKDIDSKIEQLKVERNSVSEKLSTVTAEMEGAEKIGRIMDQFRSTIKESFHGSAIESIEDYEKGEVYSLKTKSSQKIDFPPSNVLCYNLSSGDRICVRPSGTEPKIKFYVMINENKGTLEEKKKSAELKTEETLAFIKKQAELA